MKNLIIKVLLPLLILITNIFAANSTNINKHKFFTTIDYNLFANSVTGLYNSTDKANNKKQTNNSLGFTAGYLYSVDSNIRFGASFSYANNNKNFNYKTENNVVSKSVKLKNSYTAGFNAEVDLYKNNILSVFGFASIRYNTQKIITPTPQEVISYGSGSFTDAEINNFGGLQATADFFCPFWDVWAKSWNDLDYAKYQGEYEKTAGGFNCFYAAKDSSKPISTQTVTLNSMQYNIGLGTNYSITNNFGVQLMVGYSVGSKTWADKKIVISDVRPYNPNKKSVRNTAETFSITRSSVTTSIGFTYSL